MTDYPDLLTAIQCAPERVPAVQFKERVVGYGELEPGLKKLAARLGPVQGMRVMLVLPDSLSAYWLHLALFVGGAVSIPMSVKTPSEQLRDIRDKAQPHLVITNGPLFRRHEQVLEGQPCLIVDQGESWPDNILWSMAGPEPGRRLAVQKEEEAIRVITFTSGSTGLPKGVCLSESCILAAAAMMIGFLELGPERKTLVTPPLYDYYGFIQIYAHLLAHCGFVMGERLMFPVPLLRRIVSAGVTDLAVVPHTLRRLLDVVEKKQSDEMQRLGVITSSSDVLTEDMVARAFAQNPGLVVFNIYGLTEAGRACYRRIEADTPFSRSVGRPSPGATIEAPGSAEKPGEITIRGPNLMAGYLTAINEDALVIEPRNEIRTGDLGYYDENGELILVGRGDHLINVMGNKIHPSQIESAAQALPGVREAFAWAEEEPPQAAAVCLDVVLDDATLAVEEIRAHLRRYLPVDFVPGRITPVARIARTELGSKILRRRNV